MTSSNSNRVFMNEYLQWSRITAKNNIDKLVSYEAWVENELQATRLLLMDTQSRYQDEVCTIDSQYVAEKAETMLIKKLRLLVRDMREHLPLIVQCDSFEYLWKRRADEMLDKTMFGKYINRTIAKTMTKALTKMSTKITK